MIIVDHIENAYQSLKRNRGRSILTTLGIAIGIASVVAILALSNGASKVIDRQVEALDGNLALVRPGLVTSNNTYTATNPIANYNFSTSSLTEKDLASISTTPHVAAAAPLMVIDGTLSANDATVSDGTIVATTPSFIDVTRLTIRDGQFLDGITNDHTAVIGTQLAINLFGTDRPLGQSFQLHDEQFTVIGILKRTSDPVNYNNIDFDRSVLIPFSAGKQFHDGREQIQQIDVRATSPDKLSDVAKQITAKITTNHQGENDFTVIYGQDIGEPTSQLFRALTQVMTAIAAISLFVGGIGIMNIMLVNVAERTREIGIRKAVGASNPTIVTQFLIESLLISLLGGFFGYVLGYVVAFSISTVLYFAPAVTWDTAVMSLALALVIGVLFGLYPALRAARKDTIESLRQYH